MLKDRGSVKWVSLMLPEHVNMLREWHEKTQYDWTKPILDEHKFEEMNRLMEQSMRQHFSLVFSIISFEQTEELIGKITKIDHHEQRIYIQDHDGLTHAIKLKNIINITSSND